MVGKDLYSINKWFEFLFCYHVLFNREQFIINFLDCNRTHYSYYILPEGISFCRVKQLVHILMSNNRTEKISFEK